ncbi:hypothetical protein WJX73_003141 [Symbiochloris irregularis]|uniref:Uncharacterized protein n=1 Tax=Symbiochloris irregularis TaxID=706552 RepID=A0AAW1PIH3_9CHLO
MALQLTTPRASLRLNTHQCQAPRCVRTTVCSHRASKEHSAGPSRRALQFVSLMGAAGLAFLPFEGAAHARPSDMIQSRPGKKGEDGNMTKYEENASVTGQKAREPSKNLKVDPTTVSNEDQTGKIPDSAINISPNQVS